MTSPGATAHPPTWITEVESATISGAALATVLAVLSNSPRNFSEGLLVGRIEEKIDISDAQEQSIKRTLILTGIDGCQPSSAFQGLPLLQDDGQTVRGPAAIGIVRMRRRCSHILSMADNVFIAKHPRAFLLLVSEQDYETGSNDFHYTLYRGNTAVKLEILNLVSTAAEFVSLASACFRHLPLGGSLDSNTQNFNQQKQQQVVPADPLIERHCENQRTLLKNASTEVDRLTGVLSQQESQIYQRQDQIKKLRQQLNEARAAREAQNAVQNAAARRAGREEQAKLQATAMVKQRQLEQHRKVLEDRVRQVEEERRRREAEEARKAQAAAAAERKRRQDELERQRQAEEAERRRKESEDERVLLGGGGGGDGLIMSELVDGKPRKNNQQEYIDPQLLAAASDPNRQGSSSKPVPPSEGPGKTKVPVQVALDAIRQQQQPQWGSPSASTDELPPTATTVQGQIVTSPLVREAKQPIVQGQVVSSSSTSPTKPDEPPTTNINEHSTGSNSNNQASPASQTAPRVTKQVLDDLFGDLSPGPGAAAESSPAPPPPSDRQDTQPSFDAPHSSPVGRSATDVDANQQQQQQYNGGEGLASPTAAATEASNLYSTASSRQNTVLSTDEPSDAPPPPSYTPPVSFDQPLASPDKTDLVLPRRATEDQQPAAEHAVADDNQQQQQQATEKKEDHNEFFQEADQ